MREHALRSALWAALVLAASAAPCAPCLHGGLCLPKVEDPTVFSCFCPPGWTGSTCADSLDAGAVVRESPAPAPAQAPVAPVQPPAAPVQAPVAQAPAVQASPAQALVTRSMRGARDPSWAPQVLGKEEQVDRLIHDLQADISSLASGVGEPHSLVRAGQAPAGTVQVGNLVLPHVAGTFTLKEDSAHPVDSANFATFFPMILWHSLSDVFVSKDDIVITGTDGAARKVTFTITPTNELADVKVVQQKLEQEIADPASDLRELLPSLDSSLSIVTVVGLSNAIPGDASGETTLPASKTPTASDGVAKQLGTGPQGGPVPAAPGGGPMAASPDSPAEAKAKAKAKWEKFEKGPTVPMSTTMRCIIFMTIQFFAVYTLLELANTVNKFAGNRFTTLQEMLDSCVSTVAFAPMLCVLFLGTRMRANQLGVEPPKLAQTAMEVASYSVLGSTICALLIPLLGQYVSGLGGVFSAIKYVIMLGMYGGASTVVYSVITMEADPAKWPDGPPPVAPAVAATINLLVQFFAVALLYQIVRTMYDLKVKPEDVWEKWEAILDMAMQTVKFAPMLAVLFIGTRMRALQIEPLAGSPGAAPVPQPWAQTCFYVTSYAVLVLTVLVVLVPVVGGGTLRKGETEGDVAFDIPNKGIATGVTILRYFTMAAMYGATGAIVYANFEMKGKDGTAPPMSPAMLNVTMLVTQFFLVYIVQWGLITARDLGGVDMPKTIRTAAQTVDTVMFCPMLSVLFLAARMRAQEVTDGVGQPQGWVQEAMFISTGALLLKLIFICLNGAVEWAPLAAITTLCNFAALFLLYFGIVSVCIGITIMEPEVLDGSGGVIYYKML